MKKPKVIWSEKRKPHIPTEQPFDVTYIISFKGLTRSNGWRFVTPDMIIDKIADVLNNLVTQGNITEFTIKIEPHKSKEKISK